MPIQIRASRLPLLTKCSGATYLPTPEEVESDNLRKANEWGHMVHKWKETGEILGPNKRTENLFRKAVQLSGISRDDWWPPGGQHEVAVALRIDGKRAALPVHPNERDGWLTGTDDFQWYLLDDELWIDDLKTGKWYDDPADPGSNRFPQDVRSTQLRFYALAVATLLGYSGVVHVSLTHWPREPVKFRHAEPVRYWTEYTTEELTSFWGELEALYDEIERGKQGDYTLNPGDHCRFCPVKPSCLVAQPDPEPHTYWS